MPTPKRDKRGRFVKAKRKAARTAERKPDQKPDQKATPTADRKLDQRVESASAEAMDFSEMLAESVTPERWQAIIERALAQAEAGNRDARAFLAKYLIREDAAPPPPKIEIVYVPPREVTRTED